MLKIGDFSKMSRISIRMLRHYDEIGLLKPVEVDDFTGYRYYDESQLVQAVQIRDRMLLFDSTIQWLRKDGTMMGYDVSLKTMPELYVASVKQVISNYADEGKLWKILMEETKDLHMQYGSPCYGMAVFHDGEFKDRDVTVEVQQSVIGHYPDTEHVTFKTVSSVLIASTTYKGSYFQISQVNEAVAKWISDNGYEYDGLSFNIYHVGPNMTQNPEEYVTEICYPVRKKA